jgi:ABC-2 type transport system permease protein
MVLKEFRELQPRPADVAMIVALPILLLVVFGYAANFSIDEVSTAVLGAAGEQLESTASRRCSPW